VTDDLLPLLVRELSRLVQHRIPDADLPEVVEHGSAAKVLELLPCHPQFLRDFQGVARHPLGMALGIGILASSDVIAMSNAPT